MRVGVERISCRDGPVTIWELSGLHERSVVNSTSVSVVCCTAMLVLLADSTRAIRSPKTEVHICSVVVI